MLRAARASDVEAIAALHAASWRFAYRGALSDAWLDRDVVGHRQALWKERFSRPSSRQRVVVLDDGDRLLGFACVFLDEDPVLGCLLDNIHVDPNAHRNGLGSRLLACAAGLCSSMAARSGLYLTVLESKTTAQRFYYARGAVNAGAEIWDAPDGSRLPCLRLAWEAARLPNRAGTMP
jgi:ribosomal protein S18 acetylase RimI-like enzyme